MRIFLYILASFGAVCFVWCLAGLLLPRPAPGACTLILPARDAEPLVYRLLWLRSVGLSDAGIVLTAEENEAEQRTAAERLCASYPGLRVCAPGMTLREIERSHRGTER